jgi:Domain of Unknown Function (DUF748)
MSGSFARHRGRWIALGVLVVLLVAGRLALPAVIKNIVETKLETMPGGYQGTVETVAVRLLDGEIGLQNFRITKKNGQIPRPFLHVREFVLATVRDGWKPRTVMRYESPTANFVDAESEAKKQKGPEKTIETLRERLPSELTKVIVNNGTVHFRNYQTKPDMDVYAHDVNLVWDNLVGCLPPGNSACRSQLSGALKLMKSGTMKLKGRFNRNPDNDFHVTGQLRDLRAPELNAFLAEYAKVKMSAGRLAADLRYDRHGERHQALLVPLLDDVQVEQAEDADKSFLRKVGAGIATGWFERKKGKKGIAITKTPGGGTDFEIVDQPNVDHAEDASADD